MIPCARVLGSGGACRTVGETRSALSRDSCAVRVVFLDLRQLEEGLRILR